MVVSRETLMFDYGVVKGIEKFLVARFDPDAPSGSDDECGMKMERIGKDWEKI